MVRYEDIETVAEHLEHVPVVDVRSPSEYARGHVSGAFNLPLFDDEERALVGTMYHRSGRDASVITGLDLAGPQLSDKVRQARRLVPGGEMILYCWRGGMRSAAMAWLFDMAGFRTTVVNGGYKAYRRFVRQSFEVPSALVIIGGMTGSGKTAVLHALKERGEQVIDLEELACHKGSAFGALGQRHQPPNEQFENDLSAQWRRMDRSRPVWMEDESQTIGFNRIPEALFSQMTRSPLILMRVSRDARIRRLSSEYAAFNPQLLREAVTRITKRLGGLNTRKALEAIEKDDFAKAIEIVLAYYDKTYSHSLAIRDSQPLWQAELQDDDPAVHAEMILEYYRHRMC